MNKYIIIFFVGGLTLSCKTETSKKIKPNVIIFHVDDLGWTDLQCYGSDFYETPNIDNLCEHGIKFTEAYAPAAICSPSRASIQTGKYPARLGITDWVRASFQKDTAIDYSNPPLYDINEGKKMKTPFNLNYLPLKEKTIAGYLKEAGYITSHVGKWHLGDTGHYPEDQGYDINIAGCDLGEPPSFFDPYFREGHLYPWGYEPAFSIPTLNPRKEGEYLTNRLTDEVLRVIEEYNDTSFFIFYNFYAVHTPIQGMERLVEKYKSKPGGRHHNPEYAAMVEAVDMAVGRIVERIDSIGLSSNTIMIFTSDNGGVPWITSNYPLRGGKGEAYEGGLRVPFIVKWPGYVQGNRVSDKPITTMSLLATLGDIIGFDVEGVDGRSIAPEIFGKNVKSANELFWHFPHYRGDNSPYSIVREDSLKLIRFYDGDSTSLYDLKNDISEKHDLAEKFPDLTSRLSEKLDSLLLVTNARMPVYKKIY